MDPDNTANPAYKAATQGNTEHSLTALLVSVIELLKKLDIDVSEGTTSEQIMNTITNWSSDKIKEKSAAFSELQTVDPLQSFSTLASTVNGLLADRGKDQKELISEHTKCQGPQSSATMPLGRRAGN